MNAYSEIIIWTCEDESCELPAHGIGLKPLKCNICGRWMTPASYHRHDLHMAAIEQARADARRLAFAKSQAFFLGLLDFCDGDLDAGKRAIRACAFEDFDLQEPE